MVPDKSDWRGDGGFCWYIRLKFYSSVIGDDHYIALYILVANKGLQPTKCTTPRYVKPKNIIIIIPIY